MKYVYIVIIVWFLPVKIAFSQVKTNDTIPESMKLRIAEHLNNEINQFKAQLCPQFKDSNFRKGVFIKPGFFFLYPDLDANFSYNYEIKRWPENIDRPYINYYLVIKKNNKMTREKLLTDNKGYVVHDKNGESIYKIDTIEKNIPCYNYFPYDERYLIYFDTTKNEFINYSGNVYQIWLAYSYAANEFSNMHYMAVRAVKFRIVQYSTDKTEINFIRETENFYEFSADNTVLTDQKILVRIPKTEPYRFGSIWEMIYYSNSIKVPGNKDRSIYEVKYIRTIDPKNCEELHPKYRKLNEEETDEVYRKYRRYTEYQPEPRPETEIIEEKKEEITLHH